MVSAFEDKGSMAFLELKKSKLSMLNALIWKMTHHETETNHSIVYCFAPLLIELLPMLLVPIVWVTLK